MPPRIRSPTPEESESYSDSDSAPPTHHAPPLPVLPALPSLSKGKQPEQQQDTRSDGDDDDDDDLSSLSDHDSPQAPTLNNSNSFESEEDVVSDEEMEDQLSEGEYPSEAEDDVYYDDDEEEEEEDELASPPLQPAPPPKSTSTSVKIKFKLGGSGGTSKASMSSPSLPALPKAAPGRLAARTAAKWTPSTATGRGGSSKKAGGATGKGRRKVSDEASDLSPSPSGSDQDDLSDAGYNSAASSTAGSGTRLTARQRAKEMGGENGMELQSLPNIVQKGGKPVVKLSEAELALRKSEMSRKRKHQSDKKLEDEKTETINRLLKKQVGRAGARSKLAAQQNPNNQSGGNDDVDPDAPPTNIARRLEEVPTCVRWISSIKSGEYTAAWSVPKDMVTELGLEAKVVRVGEYPGPRPALTTRKLR